MSTVNRAGYTLAGAAFLVQAPRLVLTILAADRLAVSLAAERALLTIAAVGTALVLTGGGIYLAHAALTAPRWRLPLGLAWTLVLTATAGLVAPAIAGGLAGRELHDILGSPELRSAWAVLASLAHELTAAGCMLAAAATSRRESAENLELRLWSERDRAVERAQRAERELSELRAELVRSSSELPSAAERYPCEGCGRTFGTQQARSGHQRSCPARSAALEVVEK
jgi:hypothetical protein